MDLSVEVRRGVGPGAREQATKHLFGAAFQHFSEGAPPRRLEFELPAGDCMRPSTSLKRPQCYIAVDEPRELASTFRTAENALILITHKA